MQCVDGAGVAHGIPRAVAGDGQRRIGGEQPAHDLGVVVTAVMQDRQQPRQAFDHLAGIGEEDLRHHHPVATPHRHEMAFPQLLLHSADGHSEQFGDPGQVVGWFVGVQNVVAGREGAHLRKCRTWPGR
jgi:alpha-1,6-mannosyltransferase